MIGVLTVISVMGALTAAQYEIFKTDGNVSVSVIFNRNDCNRTSYSQNTLINAGIWTVERLNFLYELKLGLSVYQTCSEIELLRTVLRVYENDSVQTVGVVVMGDLSDKVRKFGDVLGLGMRQSGKEHNYDKLIKAGIEVLSALGWRKNVIMLSFDEFLADAFYTQARSVRICVEECHIIDDSRSLSLNATGEDPLVFFSTASDINRIVNNDTHFDKLSPVNAALFIPLDGDPPADLPDGSLIILPPHSAITPLTTSSNFWLTPLLFDIANPIADLIKAASIHNTPTNCNDSFLTMNTCLKHKTWDFLSSHSVFDIMKLLQIDRLDQHFVYDVYRVESGRMNDSTLVNGNVFLKPYRKLFTYNMFSGNISLENDSFVIADYNDTINTCIEQYPFKRHRRSTVIGFRSDSWVYAFISLSLLGILFCLATFTFVLVAIFQRRVLEGNPSLTLLLLVVVIWIFCSVLPFSIETDKRHHKALSIVKTLSVTMSYAALFSLFLSRAIMLGSNGKKIGFMSHVSGPVQSFLCLFIFGVQAAMSLHVITYGNDIFVHDYHFIYLMSYNAMLLILLACFTPLIYKSQRNYREGKYFSIAIVLIAVTWSVWIPGFALSCYEWREVMVCMGLVATGGICLGAIFIPRTYLMTIAAERDKITSALPSFATVTTGLDIYRAHQQPIYDCVNVAAINAATVARAGIAPSAPSTLQQPDLYSCPALPEDIDFELRSESPTDNDKVTRF